MRGKKMVRFVAINGFGSIVRKIIQRLNKVKLDEVLRLIYLIVKILLGLGTLYQLIK